jgi:hypothetical protein
VRGGGGRGGWVGGWVGWGGVGWGGVGQMHDEFAAVTDDDDNEPGPGGT